MNGQIQTQIITILFVLFFTFTLSPITFFLHITTLFNIHFLMKASKSNNKQLPCTYIIPNMVKVKSLLKQSTVAKATPIVTITTQLPQEQKEAALPFLDVKKEVPKTKSIGHFFKKLAKATMKGKKKTEYKLTFIPINTNIATTEIVWTNDHTPIKASSHNADVEIKSIVVSSEKAMSSSSSSSSLDIAQRIWDQDNTVYENFDHIVEWIGDGKPSSNAILKSYMNHFDFTALRLEQAFRNLCSKLHLKGETQQIDRILSEFAGRYFECNPKCIFGSKDVVHAIVYSLLLLNTDLHVAQGDYKKMSRSEFINNTMSAIQAQSNTPALLVGDDDMLCEDHRTSGLSFQSLDWVPLQRVPSNTSAFSSRSSAYAQSLDIPRNISSYSIGSKSWQLEIKAILKQMYNTIRHSQIANPSTTTPVTGSKRMSAAFRRNFFKSSHHEDYYASNPSSVTSVPSSSNASLQYQTVASHLQTDIPTTYTSNAPYYKEGMVVRKHLLEKANQKAKHRDWKECFMMIERSQLRMYKLDAHSKKRTSMFTKSHAEEEQEETVGGGDWMSQATLMTVVDLKHTLANALPSGYSRQRQHAFALQQSNGAVYLFQVGSAEQVNEWVSTCNYWAARESKEPLAGAVSSMEYGWGRCLDSQDDQPIYEWQAPTPPTMSSHLDEVNQLACLRKYVQDLSLELDQHRDIKPKMEAKFSSNSKVGAKAMMNWENKSHYLLHEIIKYQNYCDSIEKSLAFQNKIMSA